MAKRTRETIGQHFGKFDLDRVGFFDDPPPGPFGKYTKPPELRDGVAKGRQMLCGQPGDLFDKEFKRIFRGDVLPRREQKKPQDKAVGHLIPPSTAKKHSTPGDWFGCLGEQPTYFSRLVRKSAPKKKEPANFKIKPNPRGGPGYVDICFNPYPKHANEPYTAQRKKGSKVGKFISTSASREFFHPNPYFVTKIQPTYMRPVEKPAKVIGSGKIYIPFPKDPGGSHAGCFDVYPKYMSDPYRPKMKRIPQLRWVGGGTNCRSKFTNSIIAQVTSMSCNATNYLTYEEKVYPRRY